MTQVISTQATVRARQINATIGDILPGKGTIRRLGLHSLPNPLSFLSLVSKIEKRSKKAGFPNNETTVA